MRLLLDEMHAPIAAQELAGRGFDVKAVAADATLRGRPDEEILAMAAAEGRALVTENARDFLPIAARWSGQGRSHSGLVLTNPRRFARSDLAYPGNLVKALQRFLEDRPVAGESWTWWL